MTPVVVVGHQPTQINRVLPSQEIVFEKVKCYTRVLLMITKKWDGQALILTCYLKTEAYIFPTCMKRLPLQPLIHSLLPLISAHI